MPLLVLVRQVRSDLATDRLRAAARAAPAVAAVVHALYITRLGGDFMHARLLLPAAFGLFAPIGVTVPATAVWHPVGWLRATPDPAGRHRLAVAAAVVLTAWALACAVELRQHYDSSAVFGSTALPVSADGTIEDERNLFRTIWATDHPIGVDRPVTVPVATPDGRTFVPAPGRALLLPTGDLQPVEVRLSPAIDADAATSQFAVGTPSFVWGPGIYVVDLQSLGHPVGGHLDELVGDRPGHQKPVPFAWQVVAASPAGEVQAPDGRIVLSEQDAAAARRALGCGQLGRYVDDIRDPLTPRRFLGNIVDSVANTFFRVPPDPSEAERRFCGD